MGARELHHCHADQSDGEGSGMSYLNDLNIQLKSTIMCRSSVINTGLKSGVCLTVTLLSL